MHGSRWRREETGTSRHRRAELGASRRPYKRPGPGARSRQALTRDPQTLEPPPPGADSKSMDRGPIQWRQLGGVLVESGLLSEEELATALAEQAETGRRLGEILVGRGLISGPALANGLAEQQGRALKTEHGFGTGLSKTLGARWQRDCLSGAAEQPGADELEAPPSRVESENRDSASTAATAELGAAGERGIQPQAGGAAARPQRERLTDDGGVGAERTPHEQRPSPVPRRSQPPEAEREGLHAVGQAVAEAAADDLAAQEAELSPADALLWRRTPGGTLAGSTQGHEANVSERGFEPDTQEQALPEQPRHHLLFVPTAQGYLLLERAGAAPSVGTELDLPEVPGGRLFVSKLARAPMPLDTRLCAYLQRA